MKKLPKSTLTPSASVSLLLICGIVVFRFVYPPVNILSWDVFGYYLYLPAAFIYHDLRLTDISWVNQLIEQYQTTATLYQATALPAGGWVMKYSMGMAVLNAPAFFIAHAFSLLTDFNPDGFSLPYQYAWAISGLVYTAIGIIMLRKILLEFFDDKVTAIILVTCCFSHQLFSAYGIRWLSFAQLYIYTLHFNSLVYYTLAQNTILEVCFRARPFDGTGSSGKAVGTGVCPNPAFMGNKGL